MAILKPKLELYLQQIFRMLLESKTEETIAKELGVSTRSIQRYKVILDKRYGSIWKQKTNDTLFLECNLFKNRMLKLYKALEDEVTSDKTTAAEKAKCAEVAANITIDVLKMESEGIKAVKELVAKNTQGKNILDNLNNQSKNDESDNIQKEYDPNKKF
ncbi:MAG TPA: HTH domain-containing protein [Nitrososphaeraceae archaeon]|nr:HTH domain-containing protein [Nitrososphaeraceae archaeon]